MYNNVKVQPPHTHKPTFMARLRADTSGNVLILVAAAIIPLTAMIGSGVDMSRTYLVKSRLQQACDAGALAGRKYASATAFSTEAETQSQNFFKSNFPEGAFGTSNVAFAPVRNADGQIVATATARVPMTVMQIFDKPHVDVAVKCSAKLETGNTDVALVLDITGSMGSALGSTTRIGALKAALIDFYETLGPGDDTDGRIRYAFIPYNTNVNVGYSLPSSAIVGGTGTDTWTYQSRVANMTTPVYSGTPGPETDLADEEFGSNISQSNCGKYGRNLAFSGFTGGSNPVVSGGPAPAATTAITYSNNTTAGQDWGYPSGSGSNRVCRRHRKTVTTTYTLTGYSFTNWIYRQASVDTSGYASGNAVEIYPNSAPSTPAGYIPGDSAGPYDLRALVEAPGSTVTGGASVTWQGCIEERDTDDTIDQNTAVSVTPGSRGAYDLDIDLAATSRETKWRPYWPELLYSRNNLADSTSGSKKNGTCPSTRARRLMSYASLSSAPTGNATLSSFQDYVASLSVGGNTMHDIGFMWGARFLSGTGIFAADNPSTWNGQPVARHIIFMTDGEMNALPTEFNFHGYNELDQRVATRGTAKSTIDLIHSRRLRIACEQAKARNFTVWIIGFADGTAADYPDLQACASTPAHFKFAASSADLQGVFQSIAAEISKLRLQQ